MKSIKPGRGLSALSAAGSIGAILFGVLWTIIAFSITRNAPFPMIGVVFPLFGVIFIIMGIVKAVYHYKNATGKNRMSILDITDANEEPDPLNKYFGSGNSHLPKGNQNGEHSKTTTSSSAVRKYEGDFCPFCGNKVEDSFDFCPKCGKDI